MKVVLCGGESRTFLICFRSLNRTMSDISRHARRASILMAPFRALMALDVEGFSRTSSRHQKFLNTLVKDVLAEAFARSGLAEVWEGASFPQHTGDGYVVGVPSEYLPLLVHPLLDRLQEAVADVQPEVAYRDRSLHLRVRAAIGVGPLPDTGGAEFGDGVGTAMTETHRLLDAPSLKRALAASDPEITFVVAGLTARAYEDAVLGGYTPLTPRHFREIEVSHPAKGYRASARLYVPRPSAGPVPPTAPAARRGAVVFEAVRDV